MKDRGLVAPMNISVNELYTAHANECLSLHNPRRMQCEKGLCRGDIFSAKFERSRSWNRSYGVPGETGRD